MNANLGCFKEKFAFINIFILTMGQITMCNVKGLCSSELRLYIKMAKAIRRLPRP